MDRAQTHYYPASVNKTVCYSLFMQNVTTTKLQGPRAQAYSRNIANCVLAIMCTLVLMEILTRLFLTSPSNQMYDPVFGWQYQPNTEILHSKEGFARNHVNSIGLNDSELRLDAKLKVLVLGDSFVEAVQIPQALNFTSLLEKSIPDSEFINAGRSDANAAHFNPLIEKFAYLQPDAIVAFVSPSDISSLFSADINILQYGEDIVAVRINPPQKDVIKKYLEPLLTRSALATYMTRRARPLMADLAAIFQASPDPKAKAKPETPEAKEARKRVYEAAQVEVMTFILRSMAAKAPVTIVFLPQMEFAANGASTVAKLSIRYFNTLNRACTAAKVQCIDPSDYLRKAYLSNGNPPFGFSNTKPGEGHLNELGHRAIADSLLELAFSSYKK